MAHSKRVLMLFENKTGVLSVTTEWTWHLFGMWLSVLSLLSVLNNELMFCCAEAAGSQWSEHKHWRTGLDCFSNQHNSTICLVAHFCGRSWSPACLHTHVPWNRNLRVDPEQEGAQAAEGLWLSSGPAAHLLHGGWLRICGCSLDVCCHCTLSLAPCLADGHEPNPCTRRITAHHWR